MSDISNAFEYADKNVQCMWFDKCRIRSFKARDNTSAGVQLKDDITHHQQMYAKTIAPHTP